MQFSPEIERVRSVSHSIKTIFRHCWVERFGCPPASGFRHSLDHYLHVIEFECPGADDDELWAAFDDLNHELSRLAYGPAALEHQHVGVGYLTKSATRAAPVVRALFLVHPVHEQDFRTAAATVLSGTWTGFSISKCDVDAADPDAAYRWFAEGSLSSKQATTLISGERAAPSRFVTQSRSGLLPTSHI